MLRNITENFTSPPISIGAPPLPEAVDLSVQAAESETDDRVANRGINYEIPLMTLSQVAVAVAPLLAQSRVLLQEGATHYQEKTHDFGVVVKKMFVTAKTTARHLANSPDAIPFINIPADLEKLGERLGIQLIFRKNQYAVRDHFFSIPGREREIAIVASRLDVVATAIERVGSLMLHRQMGSLGHTNHCCFQGMVGTVAENCEKVLYDCLEFPDTSGSFEPLGLYVEGGDHFVVSDREGKRHLFIGEQHIALNHQIKRLESGFTISDQAIKEKIKSLSREEIIHALQDLHAMGNVKIGDQSGLIPGETFWQYINYVEYFGAKNGSDCAKIDRSYSILPMPSAKEIKDGTSIAAKYILQREALLKDFSQKFAVDIDAIHPLPSISYHLDCFCKPGPKGSFFLQSFSLTTALLKAILKESILLDLSHQDQRLLQRMIRASEQLGSDLEPLLLEAANRIKAQGFTVIPTPGLFIDESPSMAEREEMTTMPDIAQVNFINAISGFSEEVDSLYYIVYGTSLGDRLGKHLMEAFSLFLKGYVPSIQLYFIGEDSAGKGDFQEPDRWMSKMYAQVGIDCMTFALETSSCIVR